MFDKEDGAYKSVTLPLVAVEAEVMTVDVCKNLPEEERKKLRSEGILDDKDLLTKEPIAILPNSNNKGYCRVILSPKSVLHFSEQLS